MSEQSAPRPHVVRRGSGTPLIAVHGNAVDGNEQCRIVIAEFALHADRCAELRELRIRNSLSS